MNRVVITGRGIYSCLGKNADEVLDSLKGGRSGIIFDPIRKEMGFRSALVGNVKLPDLKKELGRKERKTMPEQALYAYVSTKQALDHAGISQEFIDENEVGILIGNDTTAGAVIEGVDLLRAKKDTTLIGSGNIFQSMNCTVTMNLSTIFRLKGVNFTISAACASGSHSIGMGYVLIKMGLQKQVICGGAQEVNPYAFASFDGIGTFSTQEDEPARASKPFDVNRDGLVPSGGAATVILESLESAQARGANILAEVVGYGFSSNGEHISNPNADGQERALRMALEMGNVAPSEVDYINAHATSTPVGDAFEAQAIHTVFGDNGPLVSSTKSMTGHECWMAGASEMVYSLLMMEHGFVAPNINLQTPDDTSAKLNIPTSAVNKELNTVLSNSFGFGGTNSTLIIRKFAV